MSTIWDVVTVLIFAGLIVVFLKRSSQDEPADGGIWGYLVAAVGLAIVNQLGNHDLLFPALALLAVTLWFILQRLRPFDAWRGR